VTNVYRWIRDALDLTQAEAGARVGTSGNHWSRWERGERRPTVRVLVQAIDRLRAEAAAAMADKEKQKKA